MACNVSPVAMFCTCILASALPLLGSPVDEAQFYYAKVGMGEKKAKNGCQGVGWKTLGACRWEGLIVLLSHVHN